MIDKSRYTQLKKKTTTKILVTKIFKTKQVKYF